jgi:O-antigen/teichoic acid export membrane protein
MTTPVPPLAPGVGADPARPGGVRRVAGLALLNGANALAALAFALCLPRWLGPDDYGRLALVMALIVWFTMAGSLGLRSAFARLLPQWLAERQDPRPVLAGLLTLRLGAGLAGATAFLALSVVWLHDLPAAVLGLAAATVLLQSITTYVYGLLLGWNEPLRWCAEQVLRGWIGLALIVPGYRWGGLVGALGAVALAELFTAAVGLAWAGRRLPAPASRPDLALLAPWLRFGLLVFGSEILPATLPRLGPALVRAVSGEYREVSFFTLAMSVFAIANTFLLKQSTAMVAELTQLRLAARSRELATSVEGLLKWLGLGTVVAWLAALSLADTLAPWVLGDAYRSVGLCFQPLAIALVLAPVARAGRVVMLVFDRPMWATYAAALALGAFAVLAPVGVAWCGALGGTLAVLVAAGVEAAFLAARTRRLVPGLSFRAWGRMVAAGAAVSVLALWPGGGAVWHGCRLGIALAALLGLTLGLRWITLPELAAAARSLWRPVSALPPEGASSSCD